MMEKDEYKSIVAAQEQPPLLDRMLALWAARRGDRPAFEFDHATLSYRELNETVNYLAGALASRGVQQGDCVLFMLPNTPALCITFFALARMSAIAVPVNIALKGEGLRYIFEQADSRIALVDISFLPRIEQALPNWGSTTRLIIAGTQKEQLPAIASLHIERFETLLAEQITVEPSQVQPGDPQAIMYTSGTTGPSKGAILPYQMLASLCMQTIEHFEYSDDAVPYTFLPLFHLNAIVFVMGASVMRGLRGVIRSRFPREQLLHDIRATGATHLTVPPFVALGLLSQPPQPDDRENPLRFLSTFGLNRQQWIDLEERFGLQVLSAYGPTETGFLTNFPRGRRDKIGSSGCANNRMEVRIVDENDVPIPNGQVGEIVCRPRYPYELMLGYHRMPEQTVRTTRNLWFHTGDAGWLDEEGFLSFADRLKDMIKRRGSSISSYEVEQIISGYPGVHEVAVVPYRQQDSAEEEVRAFLVVRPGSDLVPEDVIQYCASRMAHYMVPRYLDIAVALPRNGSGKVEKYKLRQEPVGPLTFDRKIAGIVIER